MFLMQNSRAFPLPQSKNKINKQNMTLTNEPEVIAEY